MRRFVWLQSIVVACSILLLPVSAVFQCAGNGVITFVRISRAKLSGEANVLASVGDDVACAQYCANNIQPASGAPMSCLAFNFDGRETCAFFDNAATPSGNAIIAANPGSNSYYYEKVCIPYVTPHQACTYRSHTFERLRNMQLTGFVAKSIQVNDRDGCLSACLTETAFICRSANYNYNTYFCEMSDQDRRSKPQYLQPAGSGEPIDYFDNNCLNRQNRCGQNGGNLVFVKTANFEIHNYDHSSSTESSESYCLQKCLESAATFCRSVEYSQASYGQCIVSDEDTFSRTEQQGTPANNEQKDYYEPVCIASDLSSSTCRQQAAFTRLIGQKVQGTAIATANDVTVADCLSLCFQNLECGSVNFDRTSQTCSVFAVSRNNAGLESDPSVDFFEYHCDSQFGGVAYCTDKGIKFVVNTKEPYTGAIYAAENFASCNQVVTNSKQIQMTFPPPTVSSSCGTQLKNGKLIANVVVSLDGVLPHQVTTEWDRFYRVTCDTTLHGAGEGSVVITTLYDTHYKSELLSLWQNSQQLLDDAIEANETRPEEDNFFRFVSRIQDEKRQQGNASEGPVRTLILMPDAQVIPAATPGPASASLQFVDSYNNPVSQAFIGDDIYLIVSSPQAGPGNMMIMECVATQAQTGSSGYGSSSSAAFIPFKVIDNGCPTYPALVGPAIQDYAQNRLASKVKAFRLDGSYYVQISCTVMFCAGPQGCPPSACLDSAYNNLFQSYGRRKRSIQNNTIALDDDRPMIHTSEEHLSAFIRVLAEGEHVHEKVDAMADLLSSGGHLERGQNIVEVESFEQEEMLCIAEPSFIAIIVTVSFLCVAFSGVIVTWGCNRLNESTNAANKLIDADYTTSDSSLCKHSAAVTIENPILAASTAPLRLGL